ncbi:hypothetical protein [Lacinutrix sp. 5H-3-7-4]|uniref:hypothetical protein n=1 Tax=Lacinutrix sp. (strain 5H-3-7-4) TaxID=983544 RepID=UPI00031E6E31|nr:hypothetical protein [Lacinutrix sp. 5H-3-7-4]
MMRTKFLLLAVLCVFTFSCKDDDDQVNQDQNAEDFAITNENNYYEGDLYRLYLDAQIEITHIEIISLEEQLEQDPNNVELQNMLNTANTELDELENAESNQVAIEDALIGVPRIPRIPPVPPMPCTSGACIPNLLDYITFSNDILNVTIVFRDIQTEEEIVTLQTNEFTSLNNFDNIISVSTVDFNGFTGDFIADIQRTNTNNQVINYSVSGYIY